MQETALTHTSSLTSLSVYGVYRGVLCFISADLAQFDLPAGWCCNCGMNAFATVTNHCFLLLKLNFDACIQFGRSVCVSLGMNQSWPRTRLLKKICMGTDQGEIKGRKQARFGCIWSLFLNSFHVHLCQMRELPEHQVEVLLGPRATPVCLQ